MKNPPKKFQLPNIPSLYELAKNSKLASWPTFQNSNFLSLSRIGKNWKSKSLEQHLIIPIFNLFVNRQKLSNKQDK